MLNSFFFILSDFFSFLSERSFGNRQIFDSKQSQYRSFEKEGKTGYVAYFFKNVVTQFSFFFQIVVKVWQWSLLLWHISFACGCQSNKNSFWKLCFEFYVLTFDFLKIKNGHLEVVKFLIEFGGAQVDLPDVNLNSSFFIACKVRDLFY